MIRKMPVPGSIRASRPRTALLQQEIEEERFFFTSRGDRITVGVEAVLLGRLLGQRSAVAGRTAHRRGGHKGRRRRRCRCRRCADRRSRRQFQRSGASASRQPKGGRGEQRQCETDIWTIEGQKSSPDPRKVPKPIYHIASARRDFGGNTLLARYSPLPNSGLEPFQPAFGLGADVFRRGSAKNRPAFH